VVVMFHRRARSSSALDLQESRLVSTVGWAFLFGYSGVVPCRRGRLGSIPSFHSALNSGRQPIRLAALKKEEKRVSNPACVVW
jgi:hypothetical protein